MSAVLQERARVVAQLDARPTTGTLRVLLVALALLFAGLATYVQIPICVFAFLMLGWRAWAASRGARMPGRVIKTLLASAGFVLVLASYRTLNGAEAGSALLMTMIALKLTEVQRLRDAVFVIVLAYFLLFAGFLYSQEIPFVTWMLCAGWALTAALLTVTHNPVRPSFTAGFRQSGRYLAQALPFAVVLFLLFPRIPGPLWGVPLGSTQSVSGLDDSMSPGSISNLVLSNEIAFRVRFEGEPPLVGERYWRGPTLHSFNGRSWERNFALIADAKRYETTGQPLRYTVMLEPHQRRWLFALAVPVEFPDDAVLTYDYLLAARRPVTQRRSYKALSYLQHVLSPDIGAFERRRALQLPDGFNPQSRELAARWRAEADNDIDIVQQALRLFREQPFRYTLQPPPLRGNTVDDFIFNTRAGFCEHYASAFVFLMRAAGVPARVVTGYLGGEINEFSDFMIVRQSDAHAWTEVWLPERGWTRVDPTGAVAPERIERGIAEALERNELPWHLARDWTELVIELEMRWYAANALWNEFFLAYGPELQRDVLSRLGMNNPDWRNMTIAMAILLGIGGALLWFWLMWTHRARPADPALRLYRQLQRRLVRRLGPPREYEGPRDFAARVRQTAPALAPQVRVFIDEYIRLRYSRPGKTPRSLRRLRALLGKIRSE